MPPSTGNNSPAMLLRLRSPDGMFRLSVEQDDTFGHLATQVFQEKLNSCQDARG